MGANASQLEKEIANEQTPVSEHYFGLVNFGNTCYCNSVIQALYFCRPFREKVLQYKQQLKKSGSQKENLLTCLADLFHNIASQKRKVGTIAPKKFVGRLKKENELFDNYMQQDAHEFLNYLLNTVGDIIHDDVKKPEKGSNSSSGGLNISLPAGLPGSNAGFGGGGGLRSSSLSKGSNSISPTVNQLSDTTSSSTSTKAGGLGPDGLAPSLGGLITGGLMPNSPATWIQDIFQGTLTNETRCLNCETVSSKDEDFLDLSVDVDQNTSITHCLRVFSSTETLCGEYKYYCDSCCSKQEAQKRMRIKKLPMILALHLKRFKYMEQLNRYTKLSYRVLFPLELRLFNTSDDAINPHRLYDLVAVVVHCGSTPNRGHYICVVKSHNFWLLFDDDIVEKIEPSSIEDFFGLTEGGVQKNSESGYILFYQARDV